MHNNQPMASGTDVKATNWVPVTGVILELPKRVYLDPSRTENEARLVMHKRADARPFHLEVATRIQLRKKDRKRELAKARVIGPDFDFLGTVKLVQTVDGVRLHSVGRPLKLVKRG